VDIVVVGGGAAGMMAAVAAAGAGDSPGLLIEKNEKLGGRNDGGCRSGGRGRQPGLTDREE